MSNGMKPIDPANVFQDRTISLSFKPRKAYDEVVKRMKAGAKQEREVSSTVPFTVNSCNFDFPSKLPDDVVLTNNWHPLMPEVYGCPPKKGLADFDFQKALEEAAKQGFNPKGMTIMNKEQPKLDRIKGLIEGFLLAVEGTDREESVATDSLLNKILKVIEE